MKFTFGGPTEQVYPQYLDLAEGRTLHAEPGKTYNIGPAEGQTVPGDPDEDGGPTVVDVKPPMPPDARWSKPTQVQSNQPPTPATDDDEKTKENG